MRFSFLLIVLFTLSSCANYTTIEYERNNHDVESGDSTTVSAINSQSRSGNEQNDPEYVAKNKGELSELDFEIAYEMCTRVLTDYYKAVWNGTDIELEPFIDNDNLKQYTQMKIQSQHDVKGNLNDIVQNIEIGNWEGEYTDDADGGFLYLKVPVEVNKAVGSYGEITEFLVRNINGKLVIVDWYSGTKDGYDFLVRGENLTIDNPAIWNKSEWVKNLHNKQVEFSGTIR
ncbi:hypothetical protein [Fredinandcohnia onubensis]|uniref:hypothetical protein n=1 Tax=Fredinandcohnia onubensis TaxID=1571209 RepID=UPI000C0BEE13|nr:hypothetical protein [Fredinandcohnia onubensis]